ncbi:hypothetical protein J1614_006054 [Plenodomus biglobosus]|nr:hypothetical protein J1614_006054 [Plenodomus biglobosus]
MDYNNGGHDMGVVVVDHERRRGDEAGPGAHEEHVHVGVAHGQDVPVVSTFDFATELVGATDTLDAAVTAAST